MMRFKLNETPENTAGYMRNLNSQIPWACKSCGQG